MSLLALQMLSEILRFSNPNVKPATIFGSRHLCSFGTCTPLPAGQLLFLMTIKIFHCHMTKADTLADWKHSQRREAGLKLLSKMPLLTVPLHTFTTIRKWSSLAAPQTETQARVNSLKSTRFEKLAFR